MYYRQKACRKVIQDIQYKQTHLKKKSYVKQGKTKGEKKKTKIHQTGKRSKGMNSSLWQYVE